MFFDVQKAGMTKRISAWLLDLIVLAVAATGFMYLISLIVGYDAKYSELDAYYAKYAAEYGISFDVTDEEIYAMEEAERAKYEAAVEAMNEDVGLQKAFALTVNLTLVILSIGILLAYALTEFAVPLFLKNGQTVGKKVFGLCLMQNDQTRLKPISLAVRTFLGKYAIGTMVPALMVVMLLAGMIGIAGTIVIVLILLLQIILMAATQNNCAIHDVLAATVVVDAKSQKIFDDLKAKEEYRNSIENNEKRGL